VTPSYVGSEGLAIGRGERVLDVAKDLDRTPVTGCRSAPLIDDRSIADVHQGGTPRHAAQEHFGLRPARERSGT